MDRNQSKVRAFASRRQLQEFDQAVAQGRVAIVDAIGRPIRPGDLVALSDMPIARVFRCESAEPILTDPRMAGMIKARFTCDLTLMLPSGHPQALLLIDPIESQIEATRDGEAIADGEATATAAAGAATPARSSLVITDDPSH